MSETERTSFEASIAKRNALHEAEKAGQVADSHDVRMALMARVHSGEITLLQAQKELKKIKAGAKVVRAAVLEEITRSGHKVVPVDPTNKQIQAGVNDRGNLGTCQTVYEAMLEAAPEYAP